MRRGGASIGVRIGSFKAPGASGLGSFFFKGPFSVCRASRPASLRQAYDVQV